MCVKDGAFIVKKGSVCAPARDEFGPTALNNAQIKNNILQEDISTSSPSTAGWIVSGYKVNGWILWKDKNGNPIDIYRQNE